MRLLLLLCALVAVQAKQRFDNYQVFQLDVLTDKHIQMVRTMHQNVELDFWTDTDVMVPPHLRASIISMLNDAHMSFTVINENVQDGLDAEERRLAQRNDNFAYDLNDFNEYEQIVEAVDDFVANCPFGVTCTKESVGTSYQGRDVPALNITSSADNQIIYLDSLIHCREWLAGATVLKIADRLINQNDAETLDMRLNYNWYIAPVINPDGYVYTWSNNRMWRKNREPNSGSLCVGTDLNRNFNAHWGYSGTSTDPCSDLYGGPAGGSAIETQNVQNTLSRLGNDLYAVISYHSTANMWLHAYGYTINPGGSVCARSDNYAQINAVSEAAADAVMATGGQSWVYGPVCTVIYPASGSTVDYCHDEVGAIYAFTPELRGPGFDPPAYEIEPSYEEQWAGMVAMAKEIEVQSSKRQ